MNPLISIIVPVYNTEEYLQQCIDSILEQTYSTLEIILVDDGSTDLSGSICDIYATKDSRIKVIHKKNCGLSAARNTGLDTASGDYICFVDSDDYIDTKLCERIVNILSETCVDIVAFDIALVDEKGKDIGSIESSHGLFADKKVALRELLSNHLNNYAWNKVYKRCVFDDVRYPVGYTWEDLGTTYKLLLNANSIFCTPEKLYYYRQRKGSIIHSITRKALRDIFLMQKNRYDNLSVIYPDIAELCLPLVVSSALKYYDRSLWENVDQQVLKEALCLLRDNKVKNLSLQNNIVFKVFYANQKRYDRLRIAQHKIGNVVKFLVNIVR